MAPARGSSLELCSNTIALGNGIAVHTLEYLSIAKHPRHGIKECAIEFLGISRALFSARAGLSRTTITLPGDIEQELKARLLQTKTAFVVLDQVVNRLVAGEKSSGLGRLGKGLLSMFSDNDLDKLRTTLASTRAALSVSAMMFGSTIVESKYDSDRGIGLTALAAILQIPDPTKGGTALQTIEESTRANLPPRTGPPPSKAGPFPPTPAFAAGSNLYAPRVSSRRDMNLASPASASEASDGTFERRQTPASSSAKSLTTSQSRSDRSSIAIDSISDFTDITSILNMHPQMDGPNSHANSIEQVPKQATRMQVDPSKASRWTPKHVGYVPDSSNIALASAVQHRDQKMVEQLLDCGLSPQTKFLGVAIANHDLQTLQLLLAFGAAPTAKDVDGNTLLHIATKHSFYEAAQLLIKYGAQPNASGGPNGETPLSMCSTGNRFNFAMLYLQYGADCNAPQTNGETPFTQAMNLTTSLQLVQAMLVYGADVNLKNEHGETPLFKALNAKRQDLFTLLLDSGADANMPGPKILLWPAVHLNQLQMLETLLERGADLRRAPGLLELATSSNHRPIIDLLLKRGADVNSKKDGIYTPLCSAIRDNREDLVDMLLASGADPNLAALEYPLFKCVSYHRTYLMPKLLDAGASPHEPRGIVEHAVAKNDKDALIFLLNHNCDPNARSEKNHTALTTAICENRTEMIDILLAHGADPAVRGQEWPMTLAVHNPDILAKILPYIPEEKINNGAIETAVVADKLDSVKLLLAKGKDIEGRTGGVFSPLTTSIRENRKSIFMYLCEAGADVNSPGEHLPIIKAIRRHREDDMSYIEHLLERGADINLMYRGWNAVLQALDNGDMQTLRLLAARGHPDLTARDEHGRSVEELMLDRGMEQEIQILLGGRSEKKDDLGTSQWQPWILEAPKGWQAPQGESVEDDDVSFSTFSISRPTSVARRSRVPSSICLSRNDNGCW
ncbi:related to ankyrin 3 [Ramularia collo-cygni]|uniref:Related to ankyrin 3 n=1 Tax=Ramularia collo-cygni TaxID=112498 RepID=A0A2D3VD29_9PEZI|nr:related to ankyrin 3 [Ramularia collo-cygni]CZT23645.1 related to ankyrin 3 [Ramularia collo-cygni]